MITLTVVMAVVLVTGAMAIAGGSNRGADTKPIVRIFDADGNGTPDHEVMGSSSLIRRSDSLKTTAHVSGLEPGGVYTFWWVAIPAGGVFPDNAFVANGGSAVVGSNARATVRMRAGLDDPSIEGFLIPFQPLDFDLATAEVHVEIAYHGRARDAGSDLSTWMSDFWTGTACPAIGEQAASQPHCPVSLVAVHTD